MAAPSSSSACSRLLLRVRRFGGSRSGARRWSRPSAPATRPGSSRARLPGARPSIAARSSEPTSQTSCPRSPERGAGTQSRRPMHTMHRTRCMVCSSALRFLSVPDDKQGADASHDPAMNPATGAKDEVRRATTFLARRLGNGYRGRAVRAGKTLDLTLRATARAPIHGHQGPHQPRAAHHPLPCAFPRHLRLLLIGRLRRAAPTTRARPCPRTVVSELDFGHFWAGGPAIGHGSGRLARWQARRAPRRAAG